MSIHRKAQFRIIHMGLAVVFVAIAVQLGHVMVLNANRRSDALSRLHKVNADVWYDYHEDPNTHEYSGARQSATPKWLRGVIGEDPFASVRHVDLYGSKEICDRDLKVLLAFKQLEVLNLGFTPVTNAGMQHIGAISSLKSVNLEGTVIDDLGVACLTGLTELEELILDGTNITDSCIDEIVKHSKLRYVHVRKTNVSGNGASRIMRQLPRCEVTH